MLCAPNRLASPGQASPRLACGPLERGYWNYQDPGYKEYGSDRSLSQPMDFEKVVLPNLELYERTGQYENREGDSDDSGQSASLAFKFAGACATAWLGKGNR